MGNKELIDLFKTSIEMEGRGREFYLESAKKCTNELGKRVFEALADDETRHIAAIREYCETMAKKKIAPKLCAAMPSHKGINERMLFGKREAELLKNVQVCADELEAYKIAMEMENAGLKFYKDAISSAADQEVKNLYSFMIEEEENHFDLLSNTYEYLKDPAAWFAKEEGPIVEG
ncbi:MAG: ferritin family protein [Candidatus Omnitrophica bacterium]|nr:ferritin family protein [Candidatus Omnitrophota bacterium]